MKRKQVIAFVSAAALAVTSLAGCGKTEEKTEKTTVSEAEETAKEAMRLAMHKLPIKCKFVKKEEVAE